MPLTSILAAWEKCAKEATPGPWREDDGWIHSEHHPTEFDYVAWTGPYTGIEERLDLLEGNAQFIAHFHPARVLAMIEAIRCAEKLADAGREYTKTREYQNVRACKEDQDRLERILIAQIHSLDAALQKLGEEK